MSTQQIQLTVLGSSRSRRSSFQEIRQFANLTELALNCDAMLCESESTAAPEHDAQVHHTPEDTGATAAAARAGRLIVTHVGRSLSPAEAMIRASTNYDGLIEFASPGATFTIG